MQFPLLIKSFSEVAPAGLLLLIFLSCFSSCMKKRCHYCITSYPLITNDTFHYADSMHRYCNESAERIRIVENTGTGSVQAMVKGQTYTLQYNTECTPQ
jgi:hypothetical protein